MGFYRHKECVFVRVGELAGDNRLGHPLGLQILGELLALLVEQVAQPLQEQHAEDIFLVF